LARRHLDEIAVDTPRSGLATGLINPRDLNDRGVGLADAEIKFCWPISLQAAVIAL
jgi:hypothetical protein